MPYCYARSFSFWVCILFDSVLSRLLYFPAAVDSTGHQKTKDIPQSELPPHKVVTGPDSEQSVSPIVNLVAFDLDPGLRGVDIPPIGPAHHVDFDRCSYAGDLQYAD